MCKIMISTNNLKENFEIIVYNLVFAEKSGKITMDSILQKLEQHQIIAERSSLESLFQKWIDSGILFDNSNEYIINLMPI